MPEVPKIVHDRLRAGLPGGTASEAWHPDADVLTAFAEQALSAAEREGVLQHLAWCGDCRELLALSIPPLENGAQPVGEKENETTVSVVSSRRGEADGRRFWFAWRGLRWAALAAGILMATGVLLMYSGKPNAFQEAKQQPASTVNRSEETVVAKQEVPPPSVDALKITDSEKKPALAERTLSRDKESKFAYAAAVPAEKVIARGQIGARAADKDLAVGGAAGAVVGAAPTSPAPAPQVPSVSEVVEVTAASGPVMTQEARTDLPVTGRQVADLPLNGRNMADLTTISKAKAAKTESNEPSTLQRSENLDQKQVTTDTMAQRQRAAGMNTVATAARPDAGKVDFPQPAQYAAQWAVHGNDLQRSLNSGVAWKTVLHSDRPLLCYAAGGNEIWAGGKGGDLFHSANGGVTWNQVHPSVQEQTLSDDVTHIDVNSPSQIVLFTSNNQSWSTSDGGKTWAKK